jgi:hypothetical protein
MEADAPRRPRPFVGILFTCCQVYVRIYLNKAETAYVGHCPRCAAKLELRVASHGRPERFFSAG